jgi:hypothetical protein
VAGPVLTRKTRHTYNISGMVQRLPHQGICGNAC